jgi:hypothetical protein
MRAKPAAAGFAVGLVGVLLAVGSLLAQELPIETYPERGGREVRSDGLPPVPATRGAVVGGYPRDVGVRHAPAFVEPLAGRYRTPLGGGRFGLSGWTAPNAAIGNAGDAREVPGWLSLGLSVTWGDPR